MSSVEEEEIKRTEEEEEDDEEDFNGENGTVSILLKLHH